MKSSKIIRIGMLSTLAIIACSLAVSVYAQSMQAYLYVKGTKQGTITVPINSDGTFQTPPLAPGTYSVQWGVGRGISAPTGGSADRESSAPSVSEIAVKKPGAPASTSSGGDRPQETVSLNFTKIEMTCQVQNPPPDPASGAVTGRPMHMPLTIKREIDMSSPKLMTDLGTVVIDTNGETVSGTVMGMTKDGNKSAADAWDAK